MNGDLICSNVRELRRTWDRLASNLNNGSEILPNMSVSRSVFAHFRQHITPKGP